MVRGAGIGLGTGSRFTDADAVAAVEAACPGIDLSGTLDVTGTVTFDGTLNVSTIATNMCGALTLSPATDTIIANNTGLAVGFVSILQVSTLGEFGVYGTGDGDSGIIGARYSADASGPVLALGKSRGSCINQNCIVQDNDTVGTIVFAGADGGNMNTNLARITGEVDDCCPVANSIGGALIFHTSAGAASDDITERMRINAAGDIILPDGSSTTGALALGAGADSRLYYDGTDTFLDLRATGTGDLMIALAACFPSPDPEAVHIWRGDAGTLDAVAGSQLVLEDNANAFLTILIPAANTGGLVVADPDSNIAGIWVYDNNTDSWNVRINAVLTLNYADAAFAFQQATTISTTADTLTYSPATHSVFTTLERHTTTNTITASTSSNQACAVGLTTTYNEITVVGTAGDSVRLPTAVAGLTMHIVNKASNSADVFPAACDTLNGGSANAAESLATGDITYIASDATDWVSY